MLALKRREPGTVTVLLRIFALLVAAAFALAALTGCSQGTPLYYDDFADDPAAYEFERVRIDGTVEQVEESADGGAVLLVFAIGDPGRPLSVTASPEVWGAAIKDELVTIDGMLVGVTTVPGYEEPIPAVEASAFGISFGPR